MKDLKENILKKKIILIMPGELEVLVGKVLMYGAPLFYVPIIKSFTGFDNATTSLLCILLLTISLCFYFTGIIRRDLSLRDGVELSEETYLKLSRLMSDLDNVSFLKKYVDLSSGKITYLDLNSFLRGGSEDYIKTGLMDLLKKGDDIIKK